MSACVRWDGPYSAFRPLRPALLSVVMSMPATWLAVGKNDVGLSKCPVRAVPWLLDVVRTWSDLWAFLGGTGRRA